MLKKILIGLGAVLVVLLVVVSLQPATYRVERSITVKGSADATFAKLNDFKAWDAWSPWAKLDPNMKTTYEGPATGVGASYAWTGNDDVGSGKMTITSATAPTDLAIKLEFLTPFESVANTGFNVKSSGENESVVTWSMEGNNDFMGKAFSLMMDMDEMIGADFEKGLASLKQVVEAG